MNKVICGDCIEAMAVVPAASVDMVLADLPYGQTQNAWDKPIPFGPMWDGIRRVTKPAPIPVRHPYFRTRREHCGWKGSSEQCGEINYGDDADVTCPACHKIFIADEW